MTCAEVGLLTGVILAQICDDNMFFTFDTKLYPQTVTKGNILAQANGIPVDGGGTDIHLVFEHLIRNKIFVDRVIVLSDNEINCCDSNTVQVFADRYRNEVNPDCWVHAIDLQGYGTQQFVGSKTNIIAGWNEKILKFMPLVENGFGNLVDEIQNYTF